MLAGGGFWVLCLRFCVRVRGVFWVLFLRGESVRRECPSRAYFSFLQQKEKYQKKVPVKVQMLRPPERAFSVRAGMTLTLALRCYVVLRRTLLSCMALIFFLPGTLIGLIALCGC